MSTLNGIGTVRYDWSSRPDGTAEATVWFVVGFFPFVPLRREHLRVIGIGTRPQGILGHLAAFLGFGASYDTVFEILGSVPMTTLGIVKTYLQGFVVFPLVAFVVPSVCVGATVAALKKLEIEAASVSSIVTVLMIGAIIWLILVVGRILDRAKGRSHVDPNAVIDDLVQARSLQDSRSRGN